MGDVRLKARGLTKGWEPRLSFMETDGVHAHIRPHGCDGAWERQWRERGVGKEGGRGGGYVAGGRSLHV